MAERVEIACPARRCSTTDYASDGWNPEGIATGPVRQAGSGTAFPMIRRCPRRHHTESRAGFDPFHLLGCCPGARTSRIERAEGGEPVAQTDGEEAAEVGRRGDRGECTLQEAKQDVEVVYTEERIQSVPSDLDEMIGGGLVSLERVRVIPYRPVDVPADEREQHRMEGLVQWRLSTVRQQAW
jgi:hypothetical protein